MGMAGWGVEQGEARSGAGLDPSAAPMRALIERFTEDSAIFARAHPSAFDPQQRERRLGFLADWSARLTEVDFDALPADGRIDYLLLRDYLKFEGSDLDYQGQQIEQLGEWIPFAGRVVALESRRRAMTRVEGRWAAGELDALAEEVIDAKRALEARLTEAGEISMADRLAAHRSARTTERMRETLGQFDRFHRGYDPEYDWWAGKSAEQCAAAMEDYIRWLREKVAGIAEDERDGAVLGDPVGREALERMLRREWIPYTPEELLDVGWAEYRWCEQEMKQAAEQLGFGEDWKRALDQVKALHEEPGNQPALIRELAEEAVRFLQERELATIPPLCLETWRMEMMSPERQKVNPYFTGGEVISVSFPTEAMDYDDKLMSMRGNNRHFCRATVHHELIPGHHLQLFMGKRYRAYRAPFRTPFFVEGWPLYWEMLLWDLGFAQSAEDRMGMLFWRTHRCARIVFSLSFHLGKMTADEAIDFLVEKVGHERRNAVAEVRRSVIGSYEPLYQAAYMLGGLQIRALRGELVGPDRLTDKAFHDAMLREGAIPVELIRAMLSGEELKRESKPVWRFYGDPPKNAGPEK